MVLRDEVSSLIRSGVWYEGLERVYTIVPLAIASTVRQDRARAESVYCRAILTRKTSVDEVLDAGLNSFLYIRLIYIFSYRDYRDLIGRPVHAQCRVSDTFSYLFYVPGNIHVSRLHICGTR
jgi:hypothetical protein